MFNAVSELSLATHGNEVKSELTRRWNMLLSNENVFRYKLNVTDSKLVGKFLVQLNSDRTTKRRQPQQIPSLTPAFDVNTFNFNKINPEEVLLNITSGDDSIGDVCCLVNNSPLTKFHSLLCPDITANQPQILTLAAVVFSVRLLQSFADNKYKIGYNSPGAYASVNHLHMHLIYLEERLFVEDVEIIHLRKNLCKIVDAAVSGYCFVVQNYTKSDEVCSDVMVLVEFFCRNQIPHNLFISYENKNNNDIIKIFVYPREGMCTAKEFSSFNVAFCELSGYVPVGNSMVYQTIDEATILVKIKETIGGVIDRTIEEVLTLYDI